MRTARGRSLRLGLAALLAPAGLGLLLAPSARGAISFVSASSAATLVNGAGTLSLPAPAGVAAGDVEIATIAVSGAASVTPPSGWTQIIDTSNGTALGQDSFWHIAGPGEGASSWAFSASTTAAGGIVAYRGVDTTTLIDAAGGQSGSGPMATIPSLSASYGGDLVLGVASFANSTPLAPGRGAMKRYSVNVLAPSGPSILGQDQGGPPAPGPTPAQSVNDRIAGNWVGQAIALKAAGPGGGLSVSSSASPSFGANLDAGDQIASYTVPLSVSASLSPPPGWNLTITSTQFSSGTATLASSASQVSGVSVSCETSVSNCTAPANGISYPVSVPAGATAPAAVKFFDAAAGTGAGTFTLTPTVQVFVPQNSYAGTYTSTLTISITSGP
jgi:hypothetical protein